MAFRTEGRGLRHLDLAFGRRRRFLLAAPHVGIEAILRHQSQKEGAMFMGEDEREFWQRAEARNRSTASLYDSYGMAEYEAMEAFVKYYP